MTEVIKSIENGNFDVALKQLVPLKKDAIAKITARKINAVVGSVLFTFFSFLAFCGMLIFYGEPEDLAFFERLPVITPMAMAFNKLFASILAENIKWYFMLLLWIAAAYIIPAIFSIALGLIMPKIYPVKITQNIDGDNQYEKAEGFKKLLPIGGFYPDSGPYSYTASAFFVVSSFGLLLWGTIVTAKDTINVQAILGILVVAVVVFFLYRFMFLFSFTINNSIAKLCTRYSYSYSQLEKSVKSYVKKLKEEDAAKAEEEKRKEDEKKRKEAAAEKKRLKTLYKAAVSKEKIDEDEIRELAKQGSVEANFYIGEKLYEEYSKCAVDGTLTKSEKKEMCQNVIKHLNVAANAGDIVAKFLAITLKIQHESFGKAQWEQMLKDVRKAKGSGLLKPEYMEICDTVIPLIVEMVDKTPEPVKPTPTPSREPVLKRKYCRYCNGGFCSYYSNGDYLAKCKYINNPGNCSAALLEKAIVYEFY